MGQKIRWREVTRSDSSERSVAENAAHLADQIGDRQASVLVRMVARAHGVTVKEMFSHSRSRAPIAATRQLAMYLMHVVLGRSLTQVGRFYRRDRTTVSYACRMVEDLRDFPRFDEKTLALERSIELVTSSKDSIERYLAEAQNDV